MPEFQPVSPAEVVPAAIVSGIPANVDPPGNPGVLVRGHVFRPVVIGKGQLHRLSTREARFLDKFLETGNLDIACQEIGIANGTGINYLKRPHIKRYIEDMTRQQALAAGLTMEKLMAKLSAGLDGEINLSKDQIEIVKVAARILRPSTPGLQINLQQNNIGSSSPYSLMTPDQLTTAMRERVTFIEGRKE